MTATERPKINWVNLSDGSGHAGIAAHFGVNGISHYALILPREITDLLGRIW